MNFDTLRGRVTEQEDGNYRVEILQHHKGNGRIKASPLARSIANEANVNIANVPGTGDGGRIIKRDIESITDITFVLSV